MVGDLFVGTEAVVLLVKGREIDRFAEPDPHLFAAAPVAEDLFWQIIAQAGDKYRNYLRTGRIDDLPNAGLGGQHVVRTTFEVASAFGMKADDVPAAF